MSLVPTLLAVWFLFTAKSVRLTFEPEVESVSVSGGPTLALGGTPSVKGLSRVEEYLQVFDVTLTVMQDTDALERIAFELAEEFGRILRLRR